MPFLAVPRVFSRTLSEARLRRFTTPFQIATLSCSLEDEMKLQYDRETDSLYIDLNARPSVDSREIQDGIVIDLDAAGQIVGIDIQHASKVMDLATLETGSLPLRS